MSDHTDHDPEPLVTDIRGAARMLHLSPVTVRNWIYRGRMPIPSFLIGDRRMFRLADIRAYVDAGGVWPPATPGGSGDLPPRSRRGRRRKGSQP